MIQTIKKAWAIPELRKKLVFTALILLIFRIGNAIPVPYVNTDLLGEYLDQLSTTVLGLYMSCPAAPLQKPQCSRWVCSPISTAPSLSSC